MAVSFYAYGMTYHVNARSHNNKQYSLTYKTQILH